MNFYDYELKAGLPLLGLLKKSLVHQLRGGKAKLYMNTAS
jgi:hypothetical protein